MALVKRGRVLLNQGQFARHQRTKLIRAPRKVAQGASQKTEPRSSPVGEMKKTKKAIGGKMSHQTRATTTIAGWTELVKPVDWARGTK